MKRVHQLVLIASTLAGSWLGMQAVHELGHVLACWLSGGKVAKVVLHPLTISRTDYVSNPAPLTTVWAGPLAGVLLPLALWGPAAAARLRGHFVLRFFAGFCLIANGAYIAGGAMSAIGDCREMLRHGSPLWLLWLFGLVSVPAGLWLWSGQGKHFGLGEARGTVDRVAAWVTAGVCVLLVILGLIVDGR
jgi:peptidase M50B-like protein